MYQNLTFSLFSDVTKIAGKTANVNRTQRACHASFIFFGSSLGKA